MRTFCFLLLTFALLSGCVRIPGLVYQKEEVIPQNAWNYNFKPTFTFEITDTNAIYQPYFLIRHTQGFPYCNLWVLMYIKTPGDTTTKMERVNVVLAESNGKWMGRGMGEIYEQRMAFNLSDSVRFNKAGTYTIFMEQNMRINPLPEVLNVGLRLEKIAPKAGK